MNTYTSELIVMLTHHDRTVPNASEIFSQCVHSRANFWGFKEEPLPLTEMKQLYSAMRDCEKTTFLEVVAYTEQECMAGARTAAACGCDVLMGTVFSDSVNEYCKAHNLKYMPFVGKVTGRPSILDGTLAEMISEAKSYLQKGVYGVDLLGYRYTGDAAALNRDFVAAVDAPVCIAGSVNSFLRLDELKTISPWAFTIGGAFFEHKFGDAIPDQINTVVQYMEDR